MNENPGFLDLPHTHDQRMNFFLHIHIVIPGGCLNPDKLKWNWNWFYKSHFPR
ncbi:MAG: transposase [Spirochaetales bacterium]|nr:transposase [Spirochaetales bacterium]